MNLMSFSGAGGPEDPMLEKRVDRLERILASLEPKISELLLTCAKRDDVQKIQIDIAKVEGRLERVESRLEGVEVRLAGVDIRFSGVEGRLAGVDGRLAGIEGRLSMIPTVWQNIAILGALLIGLSGLMFTSAKLFHP